MLGRSGSEPSDLILLMRWRPAAAWEAGVLLEGPCTKSFDPDSRGICIPIKLAYDGERSRSTDPGQYRDAAEVRDIGP